VDPDPRAADERCHLTPVLSSPTVYEDDELSPGQDYVVCTACGARIKATRERCLRCFEPLHVDRAELPVWRSLHISDRVGMQIGIVALVAIVALGYVLWSTRDKGPVEVAAEPVVSPSVTPSNPASTPSDIIPSPGSRPAQGQPPAPAGADAGAAPDAATPDDLAATRRAFEDKLKLDPNDSVALNGLGVVLQGIGDQPGALAAFRHAAEVAPRNATIRVNLARLEGLMGQWSRAAADYNVAAHLLPDDYGAHFNLALALQQTREHQAAVDEFQIAIQLAPREAAAHRGLAVSLDGVGRSADATQEYERYLELAPDAPDAKSIRERIQAKK
jgi:Flp pilus assembly protein TadD